MKRIDELKNWQLKLLAVFTAFLLWIFVAGSQNSVLSLKEKILVNVINLSENLSLVDNIEGIIVKYKVLGDSRLRGDDNVTTLDFEASVDVKGLDAGLYKLMPNVISKNPQIRVIAIEPETISVRLEKVAKKEIEPKINVKGVPDLGYEVLGISVFPEKINIMGAEKTIGNINSLNLNLQLDGNEKADFSRILTIDSEESFGLKPEMIKIEPVDVEVMIKIRKKVNNSENDANVDSPIVPTDTVQKTLMVPIKLPDGSSGMIKEILPANLLVTISGTQENIEKISGENLAVMIDLNRIEKGGIFLLQMSDIQIPEEVEVNVTEFSPAKVTVKF